MKSVQTGIITLCLVFREQETAQCSTKVKSCCLQAVFLQEGSFEGKLLSSLFQSVGILNLSKKSFFIFPVEQFIWIEGNRLVIAGESFSNPS